MTEQGEPYLAPFLDAWRDTEAVLAETRRVTDHGPPCPECGSCCADDCYACPACGHCDDLHGFNGAYCRWKSPGGIVCPCLLTKTQVMKDGVERWPDEESE